MKSFLATNSSRIHSVSYEGNLQELTVEFSRGGTYKYFGVPEDVYIMLVNAESVGKTLNSMVKGKYEYQKL